MYLCMYVCMYVCMHACVYVCSYTVEFSILEIYNEEIRDLIEPGKDKKLDIRQVQWNRTEDCSTSV